jgi:hypothetical protein
MHHEKQVVRNAMIVLFLSLAIVYVILYQATGFHLPGEENINKSINISPIVSGNASLSDPSIDDLLADEDTMSGMQDTQTGSIITNNNDTGSKTLDNTDIKILSGASIYFGDISSIKKLNIDYSYALKDSKEIYYMRLDTRPDLAGITKLLGGTIYVMNTEQEILQNKLFGTKVTFINIPEYKNTTVLLMVELPNEIWLLQVPYQTYHTSKTYLKNLFTE